MADDIIQGHNPFKCGPHHNPYRWTVFNVLDVPYEVWHRAAIKEHINAALSMAESQPELIDDIEVTPARINAMKNIFNHPNLRLLYELVVHIPQQEDNQVSYPEADEITALAPPLPTCERQLVLDPKKIKYLVPDEDSVAIDQMPLEPLERENKIMADEITADFILKELS